MTEQQQATIELAAKELSVYTFGVLEEYYEGKNMGIEQMGEEICTNPEKYGLVSKDEVFEFAEWIDIWKFYRNNLQEWVTVHDHYSGCAYTTDQLWEEFKKLKS